VAGCAVAVRHGLYPTTATITLRDAVSVYGSCRFGDEPDRHYRTVVSASPPPGAPAIDATSINSVTGLTGMLVIGKDETAPGEASVGMRVSASKGLTLAAVTLAAGRGGDGMAGASTAGQAGGNGGTPACQDCVGSAGEVCPAAGRPTLAGTGGKGRDRFEFSVSGCFTDCACSPLPSRSTQAELNGKDSGNAKGGHNGGTGSVGWQCNPNSGVNPGNGASGTPGQLGDCSPAGGKQSTEITGLSQFSKGRWIPSHGGQGGSGGDGSGGGGGGAGGYGLIFKAGMSGPDRYSGTQGGGGGGGGCGGVGGAGGQQGGASIPLVLINANIAHLSASASLVPGPGGHGGPGGLGGAGGPGGAGGTAWPVSQATIKGGYFGDIDMVLPSLGGTGGDGGPGGAGAGGAGGNGGPSFGIALVGDSPDPGHEGIYAGLPGTPGARGAGGVNPVAKDNVNSQCRSADGEDGLAGGGAAVVPFQEGS
jgi:hypothetical protein